MDGGDLKPSVRSAHLLGQTKAKLKLASSLVPKNVH